MINTKAYRQQTIDTPHNNIAIINAMCDELDRLYLDHTPLSREELETVLKDAGWSKSKLLSRYSHDKHTAKIVIKKTEDRRLMWFGYYCIPFSSVTRATLRSCGVIK